MVVALIVSLFACAISGILVVDSSEVWEDVHEAMANLTLLLVGLHVIGVIVSSRLHKENLPKAMITGRKLRGESHV